MVESQNEADLCLQEAKRLDILQIQQLHGALTVRGISPSTPSLSQSLRRHATAKHHDDDAAMNNEL